MDSDLSTELSIESLDLDPGLLGDIVVRSARGRRAAPLLMEYVRDLGAEDKEGIENPPAYNRPGGEIVRIRQSHHLAARFLAEGKRPGEVSQLTGYSISRLSVLQGDPAFLELVEYYSDQVKEAYVDVHTRLATLGMSAIDEIQERLEEKPEAFTRRELLDIAEMALDRSLTPGARPATTNPNGASLPLVQVVFQSSPNASMPEPEPFGPRSVIDVTEVP